MERKYVVVIIYDISEDKQRLKMAKFLNSYGHRVQKSAFEACLTEKQYDNFIAKLEKKVNKVRIYKLYSVNEVKAYGEEREDFEEVVEV